MCSSVLTNSMVMRCWVTSCEHDVQETCISFTSKASHRNPEGGMLLLPSCLLQKSSEIQQTCVDLRTANPCQSFVQKPVPKEPEDKHFRNKRPPVCEDCLSYGRQLFWSKFAPKPSLVETCLAPTSNASPISHTPIACCKEV